MRTVRKLEIKVGLLVVLGLVALFVLLMISDKISFARTWRMTAWLNDAGGLRERSPVTLAGIAIGKVVKVGNDPSGRIRALLEINEGIRLPITTKAELASSGLFGDSSLAFSCPTGQVDGPWLPTDGKSELQVAPGFLSQASQRANGILEGINDLLSPANRGEIARLLHSAADLTTHAASLAEKLDRQDKQIEATLANLEQATANLAKTSVTIEQKVGPLLDQIQTTMTRLDGGTTAALDGVSRVTAQAEALLADNAPRLDAIAANMVTLSATTATIAQAVAEGRGVLGQLVMSRELAATVADLAADAGSAARAVAERPSAVIFDDDADIARERARRDRERMRKAMSTGLPAPAP